MLKRSISGFGFRVLEVDSSPIVEHDCLKTHLTDQEARARKLPALLILFPNQLTYMYTDGNIIVQEESAKMLKYTDENPLTTVGGGVAFCPLVKCTCKRASVQDHRECENAVIAGKHITISRPLVSISLSFPLSSFLFLSSTLPPISQRCSQHIPTAFARTHRPSHRTCEGLQHSPRREAQVQEAPVQEGVGREPRHQRLPARRRLSASQGLLVGSARVFWAKAGARGIVRCSVLQRFEAGSASIQKGGMWRLDETPWRRGGVVYTNKGENVEKGLGKGPGHNWDALKQLGKDG